MVKKRGILVIAHGSNKPEWVELVDRAVSQVRADMPVAIGFLEMVEGRSIPDGIRELEAQAVDEIIVVPLFVSSGSTHIEEIGHALGVIREPKIGVEGEPLPIRAKVTLCPAMDDHPLIAQILLDRAGEMSTYPREEALLLVGHGSEVPGFKEKWEKGMENLAKWLKEEMRFARTAYASLHPDNLRERAESLSQSHRVLVVPLFLSEGYFTRKVIPSRLKGLNVHYTGKTYLPSPFVSRWIEAVAMRG
jgi:sirohydrochlorin ferrochelatase